MKLSGFITGVAAGFAGALICGTIWLAVTSVSTGVSVYNYSQGRLQDLKVGWEGGIKTWSTVEQGSHVSIDGFPVRESVVEIMFRIGEKRYHTTFGYVGPFSGTKYFVTITKDNEIKTVACVGVMFADGCFQ